MTEQELIDLRDSLSTLSDSLTDLLNRVIALEETMPVKHTYLNQILEVFTDHCGCPSTTPTPTPTPCDCENGTTTVYLRSSPDGEDSGEITVNTVAYSTIFDVPNNIMTVVRQRLYYNSDSDDYAIIFTNTSSESLCVSISGYSVLNYTGESDPIHVDNTNPTVSVDTLADTVSFCLST